ncbi:MAG: ISNCY family transposase [Pseudonocardiaceae bacterium]
MINDGLYKPRRFSPKHRAWRERRPCLGQLVQLDGSDHDWFDGRAPRCVLLIFIDDATSRILYGLFIPVEDTFNLLTAARVYLLLHGRPVSFYVDKDSIYKVNRQATIEEELKDDQPITQFTRAMDDLDVKVLCAHSPQAKGRVERGFHTHQDRLVKELRLRNISSVPQANKFLLDVYFPDHNRRCAVEPARPDDAHRPLLKSHNLHQILSLRSPRVIANDFTLRFQNRFFQLLKDQPVRVRPGNTVLIETRLDGSSHIRFKDLYLNSKIISKKPYRPTFAARPKTPAKPPRIGPLKPAPDHPWRSFRLDRRTLIATSTTTP